MGTMEDVKNLQLAAPDLEENDVGISAQWQSPHATLSGAA